MDGGRPELADGGSRTLDQRFARKVTMPPVNSPTFDDGTEPTASDRIKVAAPPEAVYTLVSDPGTLAELAGEYAGFRWLGGATSARPGARFRGHNRNGLRRWSTTCTITDADAGSRFAFEVAFGPVRISRWQYNIEPDEGGCVVTESTWTRVPTWFQTAASPMVGVRDRESRNRENIALTLSRLKERAEATPGQQW